MWQWQMKSAGTLRGKLTDGSILSIGGISGNAVQKTPAQTVDLVNQILDIGNKAIVVDNNLSYSLANEVYEND